jgi:tetratricopeptide (TPR) repeat protein
MLRQGLLFRQVGATALAVQKFRAVMTTVLSMEFGRLDYYQRLVLQSQTEIADTYLASGQLADAADYFNRLLKLENPELNRAQIQYKLVRCLSALGRHPEAAAQAQNFLEQHPKASELPEVRYLLASSLKVLNRNEDSLRQVMLLLQSQKEVALQYPEHWIYWQKRAGNDIANQLYREGDYLATLEIYQALVELDASPGWQIPVYYQIGLVFERLNQPVKAVETYTKVLEQQKEVKADQLTPGLKTVFEMARWRKDQIAWLDKATASSQAMR